MLATGSDCSDELVEDGSCIDELEAMLDSVTEDDWMAEEALDDTSDICDEDICDEAACDEDGEDVDLDATEEEAEPHLPNPC